MKDIGQTVIINRSVPDVFAFVTNPANTPKWVEPIVAEQTNEWPPKLGTIYRNQNTAGQWSEYTVTTFEPDKLFVMSKSDGFHVRYILTPIGDDATKLEYELTDNGKFEESFIMGLLEKLKAVMEAEA